MTPRDQRVLTYLAVAVLFVAAMYWALRSPSVGHDERATVTEPRWAEFDSTTATWYAKPGDWWSRRFPAEWFHGWPFRVGEYHRQCAYDRLPLGSVVRVTVLATGAAAAFRVTDRVSWDLTSDRIDLTWTGFRDLGLDPAQGVAAVRVDTIGGF